MENSRPYEAMMAEWQGAAERALEAMLADLRAGGRNLIDKTLPNHMTYLRHLMESRETIAREILRRYSCHGGPGTPLYQKIGKE